MTRPSYDPDWRQRWAHKLSFRFDEKAEPAP
jgi:hypothetical protein